MGLYNICPEGIYIKGLRVHLYLLMKRWLPSYTCISCVFLYIVLGDWARETHQSTTSAHLFLKIGNEKTDLSICE
jgi:hypothetical protein